MQLTTHTDYALRLLIYLAVHQYDGSPTVQDAARRYGISTHHLAKTLTDYQSESSSTILLCC